MTLRFLLIHTRELCRLGIKSTVFVDQSKEAVLHLASIHSTMEVVSAHQRLSQQLPRLRYLSFLGSKGKISRNLHKEDLVFIGGPISALFSLSHWQQLSLWDWNDSPYKRSNLLEQ
ncbi:unnamed protein product [Aphanomyces euteiches]